MMSLSRTVTLSLTALILASCGSAPEKPALSTQDLPPNEAMALVLRNLNAARATARTCGGQQPGEVAVNAAATSPVTWNTQLAVAAQAHAQDMARRNYFAHDSPEGGKLERRVEAAGYVNWRDLGENIAGGFTASEVIQGWLESKEHCITLMDPVLREVGMAMVTAPSMQIDFENYWVQDFGRR